MGRGELRCAYCARRPHEIGEYVDLAADEGVTPDEFVRREEGTYNAEAGTFACTECYVDLGCPSKASGWRARSRVERYFKR